MTERLKELEDRLVALEADPQAGDCEKIATLNALARELRDIDPQQGLAHSRLAHKLAVQTPGCEKGLVESLINLSRFNLKTANYALALSQALEALSISEETEDLKAQANALRSIGDAYTELGNYSDGLTHYLRSLKIEQDSGDKRGQASTLNAIGIIYNRLGDYDQELDTYLIARPLLRETGNRAGEAALFNNIAMAHFALLDFPQALSNAQKSLQVARELNLTMLEANTLCTIGEIHLEAANHDQAATYFQQSLTLARKIDFKFVEMYALLGEGKLHLRRQQFAPAVSRLRQALAIAEESEARTEMFECHKILAAAYKSQGDFERALFHHEQFHTIKEEVFNEEAGHKLSNLLVIHQTKAAQKEAEIYRLKNIELEKEIAERRQIEKAQRESESKFRNFIEQAFDGITLVDEKGNVIEWNHSAEQITGLKQAEVLGKPLWDLQSQLLPEARRAPDTYEQRKADIQWALQSGQAPWLNQVIETTYRRADGSEQVVEQRLFSIETDNGFQLGSIFDDVSERKQAEQKIRRQNRFLNSIIEAVDSPFYVINVDDYSIEIANSAARALGISSGKNATCYALTRRRQSPCNDQEYPCPLKTVLKTKTPATVEHIHFDTAGRPVSIEVHGYPILDETGQVVQMVAYSMNITARRKAEEALRKLSRAVEQSPSTIVITDLTGAIEFVNPAFTRNTGFSAEEAIGQNPRILKSGQHPPEFYRKMWATLKRGEVWHGELINKKKSGELYWEEAIISPVKDRNGETTHYLAIKDDITERKQAETRLEDSEARYRGLFENSPISLWEEDFSAVKARLDQLRAEGVNNLEAYLDEHPQVLRQCAEQVKIIDVNQTTLEMYAANSKEELLTSLNRIFGPESLGPFKRQLMALFAGQTNFAQETINYTLTGAKINIALKLSIAPGCEKTWAKVLISIIDITERMRAEAALKQAKEAAEKAQRAAEAASRAKSAFLANMNHELRTPLNAVLGFAQLMSRNADMPPEHQKHLQAIARSGQHLLLLINDVLDMSKIEADQVTINKHLFNLHYLLTSLEEMFHLQAAQKGLQLYFDRADDLPQFILADELKLRQILINLLGNAVKFTEKGGVTLRVRLGDWEIGRLDDANLQSPISNLCVEVQDTGPGIPPDQQESIFEPFAQTEAGRHLLGSTGLGLPISQKYAQLMGGDLTVISPPPSPAHPADAAGGPGAMFQLRIPLETPGSDQCLTIEQATEAPQTALPPAVAAIPAEVAPAYLASLPEAWLVKFHFAASIADIERCLELIGQIEDEWPDLAALLNTLVNEFRFEDLINLTAGLAPRTAQ